MLVLFKRTLFCFNINCLGDLFSVNSYSEEFQVSVTLCHLRNSLFYQSRKDQVDSQSLLFFTISNVYYVLLLLNTWIEDICLCFTLQMSE